jgi:hypothetical protein
MKRIALGPRDRHAQHKDLALLNRLYAAENLGTGQKIEASDLVVRAPSAPVFRQAFKHIDHIPNFSHSAIDSSPPGVIRDAARFQPQ